VLELLFSSRARVKLLALLLLNPDISFYQREISALTGLRIRAVQREVERLQTLGLLTRFPRGNQVHYQVKRDFFLFPELRGMLLKTIGLTALLGSTLKETEGIKMALIYGSYAANQESTASDIDLLVVGSLSSRALHTTVHAAEKMACREINYILFSPEEFRRRVQAGDGFLNNVLTGSKLFLIGDEDALRALVV